MKGFGLVGLGRMGEGLARNARDHGWTVVGYRRSGVQPGLRRVGVKAVKSLEELAEALPTPRLVLLSVPAGEPVDQVLDQLLPFLQRGDLVADGGNSYWGDSLRRHERLASAGLHFLDVGTSGGLAGARHGACFMVGGSPTAFKRIEPLLCDLAVEGGVAHVGGPGAGHFVKLVHNGIEFGMLQAIGEGVEMLERGFSAIDVQRSLDVWRQGSVIRGWLVDLMAAAYRSTQGLEDVPSYVDDTGEVNWLIADALRADVPMPVTSLAVMQLLESRERRRDWARAIGVMRRGFGGHELGKSENAAEERRHGKLHSDPPPRVRPRTTSHHAHLSQQPPKPRH
jgi:6-phosphogluconate dehydrogenase